MSAEHDIQRCGMKEQCAAQADEIECLKAQVRGLTMERNVLRQELDALRNKYAAVETDNDRIHELVAHYREQLMGLDPKGNA